MPECAARSSAEGVAAAGDVLYLTKPIGTGVITTSLKNQDCDDHALQMAVESMLRLNAGAAQAMLEAGASACTDITGFGLLGHAHQMAHASGVSIELDLDAVPLLKGAREAAQRGHVPAGLNNNRDFLAEWVGVATADEALDKLLYDPQTSGGLLISVPAERTAELAEALKRQGEPVHPVGRVVEGPAGRIRAGK